MSIYKNGYNTISFDDFHTINTNLRLKISEEQPLREDPDKTGEIMKVLLILGLVVGSFLVLRRLRRG